MAAEEKRMKYPIQQINNNNNDLPIETEDKVYSECGGLPK
jgi:hypothetical protein